MRRSYRGWFERILLRYGQPKPSQIVKVERSLLDVTRVKDQAALYGDVAEHERKVRGLSPLAALVMVPAKCTSPAAWAASVEREKAEYEIWQVARLREVLGSAPAPPASPQLPPLTKVQIEAIAHQLRGV